MNLDQLDNKSKFMVRLNIVMWIALVISIITYYQIIDSWNLDMNTAILYSFLLGFGVSGFSVLSKSILSKITSENVSKSIDTLNKGVTQFNKGVHQFGHAMETQSNKLNDDFRRSGEKKTQNQKVEKK